MLRSFLFSSGGSIDSLLLNTLRWHKTIHCFSIEYSCVVIFIQLVSYNSSLRQKPAIFSSSLLNTSITGKKYIGRVLSCNLQKIKIKNKKMRGKDRTEITKSCRFSKLAQTSVFEHTQVVESIVAFQSCLQSVRFLVPGKIQQKKHLPCHT